VGTEGAAGALELGDPLSIETADGRTIEFDVVGLVEDDDGKSFAVCYSEDGDEFIVTDPNGALLEDAKLAQEILDEFLAQADESTDEEPGA
jgi:hypothetical protein